MTEHTLAEMKVILRSTQPALLAALAAADSDTLYHQPTADAWTLAEVLVHLAEARGFFAAETEKVLAMPGVAMGRTMAHSGRLQNVAENSTNSADLIREKLSRSHARVMALLEGMTDAQLPITGEHVKFGTQTLGYFIGHFIVEHDQAHLQEALALVGHEGREARQ